MGKSSLLGCWHQLICPISCVYRLAYCNMISHFRLEVNSQPGKITWVCRFVCISSLFEMWSWWQHMEFEQSIENFDYGSPYFHPTRKVGVSHQLTISNQGLIPISSREVAVFSLFSPGNARKVRLQISAAVAARGIKLRWCCLEVLF